jgi:hypothetical protein
VSKGFADECSGRGVSGGRGRDYKSEGGGGGGLSFDSDKFRALDRIPEQIAELTGLHALYLSNTQITDLAPLAGMTGLQTLSLSNTQITDFAPLAGLTELGDLVMDGSGVADLRPLAKLEKLGTIGPRGRLGTRPSHKPKP